VVAVVGMGLVAPGTAGVDDFWQRLCRGEPAFSEPAERYEMEDFTSTDPDAPDRGYSRVCGVIHEDGPPDPGEDHAANWLRRALREAQTTVISRRGDRHGLFAGVWADGSQHLEETVAVELAAEGIATAGGDAAAARERLRGHYRCAGDRPAAHTPDQVARAAMRGVLPEDTACLVVDTACSSSLYAIDLGARAVLDKDVDIAYCGGTLSLGPKILVLFGKLRGLSASGRVRSFDTAADGTMFSDAAGVVALKLLSRARADGDRVLAVLAGAGLSSDGRGTAIYAPNPEGQRLALRRAHAVNGLAQDQVDLVIAHSTGTVAGDGVELAALAAEAKERSVTCVSNKSMVGHAGWAAGALSVIHAVLCLRHDVIPAQPCFTTLPERSARLPVRVPTEPVPFPRATERPRVVAVSSFGFGGTNAHLLLRDEPGSGAALRSAPRPVGHEVALVAWSTHLPGEPDWDTVAGRLAAGQAPAQRPGFGDPYPQPPFAVARMSGRTARAVDRCQLMALSAAMRMAAEHGPLWEGVEERTGVFCAHAGLTRLSMEATARCYAHGIHRLLAGRPEQKAYERWLAGLRDRVPESTEDTMPGVMANIIPARLANRLGLRGPTMTLDSGPDSGLAALHAAAGYLLRGDLDLALVLGAHGNTLRLGRAAGEPELAEGAFLLAVARPDTARERGWPVLARLRTRLRPGAEDGVPPPGPSGQPGYGGADSVIAVLRAACQRSGPISVRGDVSSPAVTVLPAVDEKQDDAGPPAKPAAAPTARRYRAVFRPRPAGSTQPAKSIDTIPPRALVIAGSADLAAALAAHVRAQGGVLVSPDPAALDALVVTEPGEDSLEKALERTGGPPDHVRLIARFPPADLSATPDDRLRTLHDLLFLAVKRAYRRLADGGSVVLALIDPEPGDTPHPYSALFTGLVKSLAWELPGCATHALITTSGDAETALAESVDEACRPAGLPVSWQRHGIRLAEQLEPLPEPAGGGPGLGEDDIVVAVGGARGITAAALTVLLRRSRPRLWVLGGLDLAQFPRDQLVLTAEELRGRRAQFITCQRAEEPAVSVAQINQRFSRLLDANEAWRNLQRFTELAGPGRVEYLSCDVTDPAATARAATAILEHAGRVDLLVNAAGLHRAASAESKSLESFRRVRDVKLLGYHNLRAAFAANPPRRWCNFGSLAGLSGLPGETDYAPANELLAATARARSGGQNGEYTLAWPKWAESGIVTRDFLDNDSYDERFSAISDAEGAAHFLAELDRQRHTGDAVVAVLGERDLDTLRRQFPGFAGADTLPPPAAAQPPAPRAYLGQPEHHTADRALWTLVLDASRDAVLREHLVEGLPTLPGTFALEIAAEAALALDPGARPLAFQRAAFEAYIRADDEHPRCYTVRAQVCARDRLETIVRVQITSDVVRAGRVLRANRPHFHVDVVVTHAPQRPSATPLQSHHPLPAVDDPCYASGGTVWLRGMFHNTRNCQADQHRATALWLPKPDSLPDHLARTAIPALLLDALIRTSALRSDDGHPTIGVPRTLAETRMHVAATDHDVARDHPRGIALLAEPGGRCAAVTLDGILLAETNGLELARLHPLPKRAGPD